MTDVYRLMYKTAVYRLVNGGIHCTPKTANIRKEGITQHYTSLWC